jgi:hypothetical protein
MFTALDSPELRVVITIIFDLYRSRIEAVSSVDPSLTTIYSKENSDAMVNTDFIVSSIYSAQLYTGVITENSGVFMLFGATIR